MSMFRNLGSALTLGSIETAVVKKAREAYMDRYARHEERHEAYIKFVDDAAYNFEGLRKQTQSGRETIIETDALSVGDEGNLQLGWYYLEAAPQARAPGAAGAIEGGIGLPAVAWATIGALGVAATGAGISGLSRAAADSFVLNGIRALEIAPVLGMDFWKSRQRERERLESIQQGTDAIEKREAEMQDHQSQLEANLPNISPVIDQLEASVTETKSANDSRLLSIAHMRTELTSHCAKVAETLQETTKAIENNQGSRQQLKAISENSNDVTLAAAALQSEAKRQEEAVIGETNKTTESINRLSAAIETADNMISKAMEE